MFAETDRVVPVVPLVGVMDNQLPPEAVAVNESAVPLLATCTFCGATGLPLVALKVNAVGVRVSVGVGGGGGGGGGVAVTVRVTPTLCGLLDAVGAVTTTEPL